ncbi:MAG: FAD binding domain-containing protein [Spirochaetales bacterium]|nr:FAD binding domain-containing protein [Spirochaetales bacterium]
MSQFLKPLTIEDAISLKEEYPGSLYLGGGTELNSPLSHAASDIYISLEALNLKACVRGNHTTILGASATFQELIDWDECPDVLKEAAGFLTSRNVRNQATLGGNIAAHLPDSYMLPILMVLEADLELGNDEVIPVTRYVEERRQNLILNIRFSRNPDSAAVKNVLRSSGGLSVLSAAAFIEKEDEAIKSAALAVSGMGDSVIRLTDVEKDLVSGKIRPGEELEKAVAAAVEPKDDLKGSAEYKKYLCGVTVQDCVSRVLEASV